MKELKKGFIMLFEGAAILGMLAILLGVALLIIFVFLLIISGACAGILKLFADFGTKTVLIYFSSFSLLSFTVGYWANRPAIVEKIFGKENDDT